MPSLITADRFGVRGTGWQRDLPDPRDYTIQHDRILPLLLRLKSSKKTKLPSQVDLRADEEEQYFTRVRDQGHLNASSAFAVFSLLEYFVRRVNGRTFDGSSLFLYKMARNLLNVGGNVNTDIRTTLKALVRFGIPPQEHWHDQKDHFDEEPGAFLYSVSKPLKSLRFFRLDEPNLNGKETLQVVKAMLASGFPVAFGLSLPSSITDEGLIPYRPHFDRFRGGQAVVAVGYDDKHAGPSRQVLLVRNCWGREWGDDGYGWLPSVFVENQLAVDFWTLVDKKWCDEDVLTRPTFLQD